MNYRHFLCMVICCIALITFASGASALHLENGDLYSSNYFSNTINHYTSGGLLVDSLTLNSDFGSEVRGLAFGSNGLLYAVTSKGTAGFGVVTIDDTGAVRQVYSGSDYVAGNLSYGKIAVGADGRVYVAGGNRVTVFNSGSPTGSAIYTNNQVMDVDILPSGNLLVLSAYQLQEISPSGSIVRTITPGISLIDARGVEYNPLTNDIYLTMLGYTGQFFRLMRLDGTTGQVEVNNSFWYGDDMYLLSDGNLLVGSRTLPPGIFDEDLHQIGSLTGGQQMFVTQMPVPEPGTAALLTVGATVIGVALMRRKKSREIEGGRLARLQSCGSNANRCQW